MKDYLKELDELKMALANKEKAIRDLELCTFIDKAIKELEAEKRDLLKK